jgi:hypothetical protein
MQLDRFVFKGYSHAMMKILVTVIVSVCLAAPAWATEAESFDPDQPFEQAMTAGVLRSLLNQALDRFEDHVEISGNLHSDETKGDRGKRLQFKFYPEGKSKSDQHFSAEGWFRSLPESGQYDWRFQFRQPEDRSKKHLSPQLEAPL